MVAPGRYQNVTDTSENSTAFAETETADALSHFDKRLAAGFGALVILLMTVVALVATFSTRQIARTHEETLTSALTAILSESINRSSFSGRYHTRRLLEEITERHPQLSYVFVAGNDLTIIAHSDPEQNDDALPTRLEDTFHAVLRDESPRFLRREADSGIVQEIVMPYHSGYERRITGVIVAGISLRSIQDQSTSFWVRLVLLIALLTLLSLVAIYGLSRHLANPVRKMAYTLQGILWHAPVYIGLFRDHKHVEQASASSRSLLGQPDSAGAWPFDVANSAPQRATRGSQMEEVPFLQNGEKRTAAVTTFSVEPNNDVTAPLLCSIAIDITEQRRAEAALREHRDQLEATVKTRTQELEEASSLLRQRERDITTLSNLRGALLGGGPFETQCQAITDTTIELLHSSVALLWHRGETQSSLELAGPAGFHLVGQSAPDSLTAECPMASEPLSQLLDGRERGHIIDIGSEHWAAPLALTTVSISKLENGAGKLVGAFAAFSSAPFSPRQLAILEDLKTTATYIIEANRALQEVQRVNESLIRQERLATLGELTATVSHELRNPLGIIAASFFSIERQLADTDDPRVTRMLERGRRGIQRCDRIIEELLSFTRSSTLSPEITAVDRWLQEELATYPFDGDVTLELELQPDIHVAIDRQALYQCLVNLLNNATDALRETDAQKLIRIVLRRSDDTIVLSVHDTGPGIDPTIQEHLFEPLFSTKGFGTGLGLALVQKLIALHHGRIEITSHPGEGTTATLTIPTSEQPPPAEAD